MKSIFSKFFSVKIILYVLLFSAIFIISASFITPAISQSGNMSAEAFSYFRDALLLSREGHYDEAIQKLQRASRIDTSTVILKTLGDIYIRPTVRKYDLAAGVYEIYLQKNPFDNRTINIILQIYSSMNRYARGQNVISRVINAGNTRPEYYVTLIDFYLKDKKVIDAQNTSILFLERTGESEDACQQVAELFLKNSMVIEGQEFFTEYIKNNSDVDNMGIIAGILYEAQKNFSSALQAYRDVLKRNNHSSTARARYAGILISTERYDEAVRLYENIDFDDPSEIPVKLQIVNNLISRENPDYERIEKLLLPVKDKFGVGAQVFYLLGITQGALQNYTDSEENLLKSVKMVPANPLAHYYLADTRFRQNKFETALTAITKAIEIRPDIQDFYVLKGLIYDRLGDVEATVRSYEEGMAVNSPESRTEPTLMNNLAYVLAVNDMDLERALELAKKAVLADQNNSSFQDTIGWVYYKMNSFEEALNHIKRSLEINPNSSEVLDHLGDVYQKLEQISKAVESWEKALEQDQDNERIKEKLRKNKDN